MSTIEEFLKRCDAYCTARGISAARLSTILFNDGKKLTAVREGADVGSRRLERALVDLGQLERARAANAANAAADDRAA